MQWGVCCSYVSRGSSILPVPVIRIPSSPPSFARVFVITVSSAFGGGSISERFRSLDSLDKILYQPSVRCSLSTSYSESNTMESPMSTSCMVKISILVFSNPSVLHQSLKLKLSIYYKKVTITKDTCFCPSVSDRVLHVIQIESWATALE